MKIRHLAISAATLWISVASVAFAADKEKPAADLAGSIAVVDIQYVVEHSTASKGVSEYIRKKRDAYQEEITKQEEQLRTTEQKLQEQQASLSKEAFEQQRKQFRDKINDVQANVQKKRANLDSAFQKSVGEVQKVVLSIVADLAKERGFKIAIPSSQILYTEPGLNITEEVLTRLNKKMPKLEIKIEEK